AGDRQSGELFEDAFGINCFKTSLDVAVAAATEILSAHLSEDGQLPSAVQFHECGAARAGIVWTIGVCAGMKPGKPVGRAVGSAEVKPSILHTNPIEIPPEVEHLAGGCAEGNAGVVVQSHAAGCANGELIVCGRAKIVDLLICPDKAALMQGFGLASSSKTKVPRSVIFGA